MITIFVLRDNFEVGTYHYVVLARNHFAEKSFFLADSASVGFPYLTTVIPSNVCVVRASILAAAAIVFKFHVRCGKFSILALDVYVQTAQV